MVINKHVSFLLSIFLNILILHVRCQKISRGGEWEMLQKNIGISAMHMQLLHNDKIVVFDRTDFGCSNLSLPRGRCRYDLNDTALKKDCTAHSLLYDIAKNSFRPLMVQTDTWCSSGSVIQNGTLVQIGGFNDGERTIRTITPCDTDECDWVEYHEYLDVRRWYASNQILPDGRIIVIGGRREFNYEFYSREPSKTTYRLDFLKETRDEYENNLYPFLHLLPDGHLFIFANTRSISFDYVKSRVVRRFPPIPGNDPRNYPSSGSSVLLPIRLKHDTSKTEAEVLVCGGATQGAFPKAQQGKFQHACSTCGRIKVTDPDPIWEMEEMPMPRVMGDMLILPTGDVLIINGAGNGTAGWENARDPVTYPIVYRTKKKVNKRFLMMSPTKTARLYHSVAVVLRDGRVLVGGSNPHRGYIFKNVLYPTELSLEAFSPPYLQLGYNAVRPKIVSGVEILEYGHSVTLTFSVSEYRGATKVSITMLAPAFTTHSFGMNQRMVVLRVMEVRQLSSGHYQVTAVGPPRPEIAPSGYYIVSVVHAGIPSKGVWANIQ